jgi:hypothetical protein
MEMEFMHYPVPKELSKFCGNKIEEAVAGA